LARMRADMAEGALRAIDRLSDAGLARGR
jgi:hypothetical protein